MTDEMAQKPQSPPASHFGTHHVRVLVIIAVVIAVHVWFFGVYVYGWVFQPFQTLEDGDFISTQVDFSLIPALPDALAESYDLTREEQLAQLTGGEENTLSIDNAKAFVLEQGFSVREGDVTINEDTSDDIVVGNERRPGDDIGFGVGEEE
ncbi:MAG: hypothetical protein AAF846_16745 [Chloroflexota bacterium]